MVRKIAMAALLLALIAAAAGALYVGSYRRGDRQTAREQRTEIAALENERDALRAKLNDLAGRDPRREGMPDSSVRIGVPTALATDLVERLAAGFVDRVTLDLKDLKVRKRGTVKKIVTLGEYDLRIDIHRVIGRLKTGKPVVGFGGNRITVWLPVAIASGTGNATIHFKWDGKNISGAVCGDQDIVLKVHGGVKPDTYALSGGLVLSASTDQILAEPVFPLLKVNLKIDPSAESWAAARKILDDRTGACGFVLDRVNVLGHVQRLIDKGFNVRLPTEKIKPLALPVGIHPTMEVRGQSVALGIKVTDLAITKHVIWLGSQVSVVIGEGKAAGPPSAAASSKAGARRQVRASADD
ncbi:MAG: hypothetical protein R6V57_06435 [Vicinamibacterales bacterium]